MLTAQAFAQPKALVSSLSTTHSYSVCSVFKKKCTTKSLFSLLFLCVKQKDSTSSQRSTTGAPTESMFNCCRADGGNEAASMRIAEQYLTAFGGIAKAGTTLLLPASSNDPASMVAQALSIYNNVSKTPLANPR